MEYEVNVEIDEKTMKELKDKGFSLYAFKAVKSDAAGSALVWFSINEYLTKIPIVWMEKYRAYISTDELIPNNIVYAETEKDIDLGQIMDVDKYGICTVVPNGVEGAIRIDNLGEASYICGISEQKRYGTFSPYCAFKLNGKDSVILSPINKVLLMFATEKLETQTVLEKTLGPGVLIDLARVTQRNVSYDIDKGWDWGGEGWGKEVPTGTKV